MSSTTVRRRGPRTDVDSRALIVDVAERMFGDATIDAVSLRAVAREADLGTRAVTYHFASKRDLVAAVLQRRFPPLTAATFDGLLALTRHSAPSVRDLIEAMLNPFVGMLREDPHGGLRWMKIFTQLALSEDQLWADQLETDPTISELFVSVAARALPDVSDEKVQRRASIAMYSMITMLASADRTAFGKPLSSSGLDPGWVEQLIIFTAAGLRGELDK